MKNLLTLSLLSLTFILSNSPTLAARARQKPAPPVSARVGYVLDGDTFAAMVMLEGGIEISVRVRIIDIDTPEMSGACDREIQM